MPAENNFTQSKTAQTVDQLIWHAGFGGSKLAVELQHTDQSNLEVETTGICILDLEKPLFDDILKFFYFDIFFYFHKSLHYPQFHLVKEVLSCYN